MLGFLLKNAVTRVWLLLAGLTGVSWWLGAGETIGTARSVELTTVGLLLLAFFKVRLVILYFMEIRTAPWILRCIFETWVVVVCLAVITIYLLGSGVPV